MQIIYDCEQIQFFPVLVQEMLFKKKKKYLFDLV